jgi:hypothetical protein
MAEIPEHLFEQELLMVFKPRLVCQTAETGPIESHLPVCYRDRLAPASSSPRRSFQQPVEKTVEILGFCPV